MPSPRSSTAYGSTAPAQAFPQLETLCFKIATLNLMLTCIVRSHNIYSPVSDTSTPFLGWTHQTIRIFLHCHLVYRRDHSGATYPALRFLIESVWVLFWKSPGQSTVCSWSPTRAPSKALSKIFLLPLIFSYDTKKGRLVFNLCYEQCEKKNHKYSE